MAKASATEVVDSSIKLVFTATITLVFAASKT